jgi:hypothetical protein
LYLGVPNVIVGCGRELWLNRQIALSVSGFLRAVWAADESELLASAVPILAEFANFSGVLLKAGAQTSALPVGDGFGRRDLWIDLQHEDALLRGDDVSPRATVILWRPPRNERPETALANWEKQGMAADVTIGCSIQGNPPIQNLQRECEVALRWLRAGRIAGLVFGTGRGIGPDSAAVRWVRQWIAAVGDQTL